MWGLELTAYVTLVFWVLLTLDRRRRWPRDHVLCAGSDEIATTTRVRAVVPARNEADVIGRVIPALLLQELTSGAGGTLDVVLVDDRSEDGTAEAARQAASRLGLQNRLHVRTSEPPPPGWVGKVHAMQTGYRAACELGDAAPEWILFTDADIVLRPGALAALLDRARRGPHELVSVMARLHARSFWERLLIPPFVYFFQLLYPFRAVSDPRSGTAAAAGGCMLVSRAALERAGGLSTIREALIDDVALARALRDSGSRLWLGLDPGIVSIRPYPDLSAIWDMVARSAFVQLRYRYDLLALILMGILLGFVAPAALAVTSTLLHLAAAPRPISGSWLLPAAAGALTWCLQALALLPSVRHHRVPVIYCATLPLGALLYGCMTFTSAWRHFRGRGARWKGREYGE